MNIHAPYNYMLGLLPQLWASELNCTHDTHDTYHDTGHDTHDTSDDTQDTCHDTSDDTPDT